MSPLTLLIAFGALLLLAIGAVAWRRSLVMSLPFLVILNGLPIPFAGVSVRLDQIAACLLVVPLIASVLIGARRFRWDSTVWWLAAILAQNVLASALHSPVRAYSLAQCANLASAWVIYVLLLNFLDSREELEAFLQRVLWAALAASAIGIAAYFLALFGLPVGGAEVSESSARGLASAYGAYGTMVEPNILGSFTAAYLVLAVGLLVAALQFPAAASSQLLLKWVAGLAAVSLLLTFTRAAWLGATVGLVWLALLGARSAIGVRFWRLVSPLAAGGALAVLLLLLPGNAGTILRFKIANLVNLGSQTVTLRLLTYTMAFQQMLDHPLIGWGTFTFAPLTAQGADFQQFDNWRNLWIGNFLVLALHDTGILGLGLWIGFLGSVIRRGVRTFRAQKVSDPSSASRLLALTAAVVTLFVAFLATSGFSLGYGWLLIGLLGACCHSAVRDVAQSSVARSPAAVPAPGAESLLPTR